MKSSPHPTLTTPPDLRPGHSVAQDSKNLTPPLTPVRVPTTYTRFFVSPMHQLSLSPKFSIKAAVGAFHPSSRLLNHPHLLALPLPPFQTRDLSSPLGQLQIASSHLASRLRANHDHFPQTNCAHTSNTQSCIREPSSWPSWPLRAWSVPVPQRPVSRSSSTPTS